MKVLITGGAGYLGARLAKYLISQNYKVYILDKEFPSEISKWKSQLSGKILGDIRDKNILRKAIECEPDCIIHTVSLDHKASQEQEFSYVSSINITPTFELLNEFRNKGLSKFIYFSTQQVYGNQTSLNITEDLTPSPKNIYGLTHLISEKTCNFFNLNSKIKCINVRLSNSYGPPVFKSNNCWWLVINDFCKTAFEKKKILISSDGTPQRDFININDVTEAINLLLKTENEKILFDIYNLGSGQTLTILELAEKVSVTYEEIFKEKLPIFFTDGSSPVQKEKKKIEKFHYNIDRLKSLGFSPKESAENGIKEIFNFLKLP